MDDPLLSLGLILVLAKVAEGVFGRLKQSAIVAYTATGILLGPVLGIVEPSVDLALFFSIGVIFLFFLIGVDEIDISGFAATVRGRFFLAALVAVVVPLLLSLTVTYYVLDLPLATAIGIAGILALSSLGVTAKVLSDLGHLKEPLGLEIFTVVLIAELLALLVVGFTLEESSGEGSRDLDALAILFLLGQMAAFAVVGFLLASRFVPPLIILLRRFLNSSQLAFGLIVGGLLLAVVAAEEMGLHGSLGALLVGTALSGIPHSLRNEVMPGLRSLGEGLFIPLFFASAGLRFDLSLTDLPVSTIAAVVAVAVGGKFAGSALAAYVSRLAHPFAIASGLMAKGVAEIALLLLMLESGAITQDVFSLLMVVLFGFIFVMPPVLGFSVNRAKALESSTMPRSAPPSYARYALDGVTVGDVLERDRSYPRPNISVLDFTEQWVVPRQQDYLVVDAEGRLAGILSLGRLRFLSKKTWAKTPISRVLRGRIPRAWPDEPIDDALERMTEQSLSVIPVLDRETEQLLGGVTSQDILGLIVGTGEGSH